MDQLLASVCLMPLYNFSCRPNRKFPFLSLHGWLQLNKPFGPAGWAHFFPQRGARECVCFTRSPHLKMRDVDPSVRNLRGTCCQMGILDLSPDPLNWKLWEESLALAAQSRLALPQVAPPTST